jgi:hypothetical protein
MSPGQVCLRALRALHENRGGSSGCFQRPAGCDRHVHLSQWSWKSWDDLTVRETYSNVCLVKRELRKILDVETEVAGPIYKTVLSSGEEMRSCTSIDALGNGEGHRCGRRVTIDAAQPRRSVCGVVTGADMSNSV